MSGDVPVVDANGNGVPIAVSESPNPGVKVSVITLAGAGTLVASNPGLGTAVINVGSGITMVTYTNVHTQASITVANSEPSPGPDSTVTAGQAAPISYQLAVTNSGGIDPGSATVTDTIPTGTSYIPGTATCPPATPTCNVIATATTITWTLTAVPPLSTLNLSFQVAVDAADINGSTITNQATFTDINTPGCAKRSSCSTRTVTNPVVTPASITVVKGEPSPGPGSTVTAGQPDPITYGLAVINSGGSPSSQVIMTDSVPAGTTYVAGSAVCPPTAPSCSVTATPTTLTWTLTAVPALATLHLSLRVTVDASDINGSTITNQAGYTNVNTPNCSGDPCMTNTITNPVITPASITVVKSEPIPGPGSTVTAGQAAPMSYQLAVTNVGGTDAGSVTVTDDVPAGTTYIPGAAACPPATSSCSVTATAATITWTLTAVPALVTVNLSFQVSVDGADTNGSAITNQASFTTTIRVPSCTRRSPCATNTITNPVVTPASITVANSEPSPGPGSTVTAGQAAPITYQLAVTNSGGTDPGFATVTDNIPTGTTYVPGSAACPPATPTCNVTATATTVMWTLTAVPPVSTVSLSFQVSVDASDANRSTISNQATFTNINTPRLRRRPMHHP